MDPRADWWEASRSGSPLAFGSSSRSFDVIKVTCLPSATGTDGWDQFTFTYFDECWCSSAVIALFIEHHRITLVPVLAVNSATRLSSLSVQLPPTPTLITTRNSPPRHSSS
jgi:hypothetical protein